MSLSNSLQTAIYERLTEDAAVTALVDQRVYDPPPAKARAPYISFGPAYATEDDAECITGQVQTIQIDIWSEALDGQRECKAVVDAVRRSLHGYDVDLDSSGALVEMRVTLIRVLRDPDNCWHGVVQVSALIEEF